ncbi:MAG: hypothetical protein NVS3B26_19420 [Mycobacteriales bacterium]
MSTVEQLLALTGMITVLLTVVGALAVRLAARRVHRRLTLLARGWLDQATHRKVVDVGPAAGVIGWQRSAAGSSVRFRKVLSAGGLRSRALLPGAQHDIDRLRQALRADVNGAVRAIRAGEQAGRPLLGLGTVAGRLEEQARALDVDLAVLAAEPDRDIRRTLLARHSDRVASLRHDCRQLRHGVVLAGGSTPASIPSAVTSELNDEIIALSLRAQAFQELSDRR